MKKFHLMSILFFISIFFMTSCKKNVTTDVRAFSESTGVTIDEARNWFEGSFSLSSNSGNKLYNSVFSPVWESASVSQDEHFYIVECDIISKKSQGFTILARDENSGKELESITKLLILKDKAKGQLLVALMNTYPYVGKIAKQNKYMDPGKDFTGMVFYTDLNNNFINGWEYKNGAIVAKTQPSKSKVANRIDPDPSDCEDLIIDTYERDCFYFEEESMNYCTEWQYVGSINVTSCPSSSGGGVLGSEQVQSALFDFKSNYELSPASYIDEIVLLSQSGVERTKDYNWICAEANLLKAKSLEYGVHQKVNNQWKWKSLTHQSISLVGHVIGGSVNIESESGIAQLGQYNAGMHVDFTVHYSVLIPNVSPISWYYDYSVTKYFNVND